MVMNWLIKIGKKITLFTIVVTFVLFVNPWQSHADKYFRGDCANSGNGASWVCAESPGGTGALKQTTDLGIMTLVPQSYTWLRGTTYWFVGSDASYGTMGFRNSSGTATDYITIKRATDSLCTGQTGWETVTSDEKAKQAIFGRATIRECSYIEIDGVTGDGISTAGYGFKFEAFVKVEGAIGLSSGYTHNYIKVSHCEITSRGDGETWSCYGTPLATGTYAGETATNPITFSGQSWETNALVGYDLINITTNAVARVNSNTDDTVTLDGAMSGGSRSTIVNGDEWNIAYYQCAVGFMGSGTGHEIRYNYMHHLGVCASISWTTGAVFANNYCRYNHFNGEHHNPMFVHLGSTNATIENNIFEDGTGTTCIGTPGSGTATNTIIRNNVFRESDDNPENQASGGFAGEGIIGSWSGQSVVGIKIYNNTFYNFHRSSAMVDYDEVDAASGVEIKNNLWYCDKGASCKSAIYRTKVGVELTTQNNAFYGNSKNANETDPVTLAATNPFTNSAGGDFSLKSCSGGDCAIDTGVDLSASWPSALDYIGTSRPQGAGWDIGAYEYVPLTSTSHASGSFNLR